jgi:hypothetical protein
VLTLAWTIADRRPDSTCTVLAGRLPLRAHRDLPAAMAWMLRTRRHLAVTPGLAGQAAAVELSAPALWIVSAWTSRADLVRFDHSHAHQAAKSALRPRLWPASFVVWTCRCADLPVAWAEVRRRIDATSQSS